MFLDKKTLLKIWLGLCKSRTCAGRVTRLTMFRGTGPRPNGGIFSFGGWGQVNHTPRERLGLVSLTQPNMADGLGFARKQLEKHGWSEGKIAYLSNENEICTNKAVNKVASKFVPSRFSGNQTQNGLFPTWYFVPSHKLTFCG